MAITGITFDNQTVTPKNDGQLYRKLLTDGVLTGCTLTFQGNTLYLAEGYLLIAGRLARLVSRESIQTSPLYADGYGQLKLKMNLENTSSSETFEQLSFIVTYAGTDSFPALVQQDVNGSGTLYEMELAVVKYESGSIASIVRQPAASSLSGAAAEDHTHPYIPTAEKGAASGVASLDANGKVTAAQNSAYVKSVSSSTSLQASDAGKVILASGTITLTLPTSLENGTEVEIWNIGSGTVTLSGTLYVAGAGNASSCTLDKTCAAACKLISSKWYVGGGASA